MDEADPRSPLPSFSLPFRKKGKAKRGGDSSGAYARVLEELDESEVPSIPATVEEYGLLWRMWRVTKPLVGSPGGSHGGRRLPLRLT